MSAAKSSRQPEDYQCKKETLQDDATSSIQSPQAPAPAPHSYKQFEYAQLQSWSREGNSPDIRLLELLPGPLSSTIKTQLIHTTLGDRKNGFAALSYEWGGDSSTPKTMQINGETFGIRHNLWKFLLQIRHQFAHRLPMMLWVDSICINQDDLEEKSRQVRIMHKIYAHAYEVLVWLGDGTDLSPRVFYLLRRYVNEVMSDRASIYTGTGSKRSIHSRAGVVLDVINNTASHDRRKETLPNEVFNRDMDAMDALLRICRRTYWTRAWIIQECLNARNVSLFCGSEHLPHAAFPILGDLCWQLMRKDYAPTQTARNPLLNPRPQSPSLVFSENGDPIGRVIELTRRWYIDRHDGLESLLQSYHGSKCSNLHDKVYAFLGLSPGGDQFPVDYTVSLYQLLAQTIIFCNNSKRKAKPNEIDPIRTTCDSIHIAQLVAKDLELSGGLSTMYALQQYVTGLPDSLLGEGVTVELDYLGQIRFPVLSPDLDGGADSHNRYRFKVNMQTYETTAPHSSAYGDRVFALRGTPLVIIYRRTFLHLQFVGLAMLSTSESSHEFSRLLDQPPSWLQDDSDTDTDYAIHQAMYRPIRSSSFPPPDPIPRYSVRYGHSYTFRFFRRFILPVLPAPLAKLLMTQSPDSAYYASPYIRIPLKYVLDIMVLWPERTRSYGEYCEDLKSERETNKVSIQVRILRSAADLVLRIKNSFVVRWNRSAKRTYRQHV